MSSTRPSLSVVVPTRDTRELTLRCLASLVTAGTMEREVIVVDEASGDGTGAAVGERFPGVRLLANPRPLGFTAAANRGLAAARGDLLVLLNSDTEVDPGALDRLAAAFAADASLGIAGATLRYPDGGAQWSAAGSEPGALWLFAVASGLPALLARLPGWRRLRPPAGSAPAAEGGAPAAAAPRPAAWVTGAALALRRAVWQACGPLDERYRFYAQDLDLCLAAGDAGWRVAVVPGFGVVHHHGATIGGGGGGGGRQNAELLWTDLVRWAGKRRGPAGARRAARALLAGAWLRRAGRALALPWAVLALPPRRRAAWRAESARLATATAAVRRLLRERRAV